MRIVNQSHEILSYDKIDIIERAGRTCYQTQNKTGCATKGLLLKSNSDSLCSWYTEAYPCANLNCEHHSSQKFVKMLRDKGHHAMIEFGDITVKFITNRGVLAELTRHRHCSFAVESTRYVKYDGEMEFIKPVWCSQELLGKYANLGEIDDRSTAWNIPENIWMVAMRCAEADYRNLLQAGWKAQQAREVLPNSLKTEIIMKCNFREMRHILELRCSPKSHPQMVALMLPLLAALKKKIPVVFDDLKF